MHPAIFVLFKNAFRSQGVLVHGAICGTVSIVGRIGGTVTIQAN